MLLLAELISFQYLLQKDAQANSGPFLEKLESGGFFRRVLYRIASHWSWGSIVFFSLSTILFLLWTTMELVSYGSTHDQGIAHWAVAGSILANISILLFIPHLCSEDKSEKTKVTQSRYGFFEQVGSLHSIVIEYLMTRLLGVNGEIIGDNESKSVSAWRGRTNYLKNKFEKALNTCERNTKNEIERIISKKSDEIKLNSSKEVESIAKVITSQTQLFMKNEVATLRSEVQEFLNISQNRSRSQLESYQHINKVELDTLHQRIRESEDQTKRGLAVLNRRMDDVEIKLAAELRASEGRIQNMINESMLSIVSSLRKESEGKSQIE